MPSASMEEHQSLNRLQITNTKTNHSKMKSFIVLALCFAAALAAPASQDALAQIVRYDNNNIGVDGYQYAVETSNGIVQNEQAQLQDVGTDDEGIAVRGQYSYTGDDGVVYSVVYVADKNGFQPQGSHLPTN